MLAFVGQLAAQSSGTSLVLRFAWTFAGFGAGAVLTVLAAGFGYLAQSNYHEGRKGRGDGWRRIAVAAVLCSLLAFTSGLGGAFYALVAAEQQTFLAPAGTPGEAGG